MKNCHSCEGRNLGWIPASAGMTTISGNMNPTPEQEAIINFLLRIYGDILEIEEKFSLIVGGGDKRARIEYFHDAVRAFSSGNFALQSKRLKVENLAYDLRCLEFIQQMPLSPFREDGEKLSPQKKLINLGENEISTSFRPDRETKYRLAELYQNYAVLFAALLKPAADRDYKERTEHGNEAVKDAHAMMQQIAKNADIDRLASLAQHIENNALREMIFSHLQKGKHKKQEETNALLASLKIMVEKIDKDIKDVDKAHGDFAMSQLKIFENSKDLLKKMAKQGMNIIGKFVENAIAESRRQMGR